MGIFGYCRCTDIQFIALRIHVDNHLPTAMRRQDHYYVYVIELSKDVLYEPRFMSANPDCISNLSCS